MARRVGRRRTAQADLHRKAAYSGSPARGPARTGIARLQRSAGNTTILRLLRSPAIERPIQRLCPECEEEETHTSGGVQAKRASDAPPEVSPELESYLASSRNGGQPLPDATRAYFEPRFDRDFSQVRLHADSPAANAAADIDAQAFTSGSDVYFGMRRLQLGTSQGHRLLAHELTHVMQQTSPPAPTATGPSSSGRPVQRAPRDPGRGEPSGMVDTSQRVKPEAERSQGGESWLIRGPRDSAPRPVTPTSNELQGIWDEVKKWLRRKCKFWLCETYTVCKPPEKDEDWWKPWKWKCIDVEVCWCYLHEPDEEAEGVRTALAMQPADVKAAIRASGPARFVLRFVIGDAKWPEAERILADAQTKTVAQDKGNSGSAG